ncbi:hypothetical protein SEA_INDRA_75 [Mycobacterium phage Indra]|nr:hypothetical protein SEA_INDRA_75 [Mycobacterium phage Indra]
MNPCDKLRDDIKSIAKAWLFENRGSVDDLADSVHSYVIETYGPPF